MAWAEDTGAAHVAGAVVALAAILFWYMTENRVWDCRGKRLPGMDSHYRDKNFFTVLRAARRRKCASTVRFASDHIEFTRCAGARVDESMSF